LAVLADPVGAEPGGLELVEQGELALLGKARQAVKAHHPQQAWEAVAVVALVEWAATALTIPMVVLVVLG
jgi:hypothetical protein